MKNINKYFLGIVIVAIILFGYSGLKYNQQISDREKDYAIYIEVQTSIKTGENLESSLEKLEKLEKVYNESYVFNIDKGIIYDNLQQPKKALEEFEKAFGKNKSLYKNVNTLIVYGKIAYLSGDDEKAKKIISQAQEIGIPQEHQKLVDKILS